MKKLFVGNLSWKTTEDNLKSLFEKFGPVASVRIIADQYSGKSRGFGFVEMENAEAAQKAIQALNEQPFMDRNIRVSLALERSERTGGGGGGGGGREYRGEGSHGSKPYRPRSAERTY